MRTGDLDRLADQALASIPRDAPYRRVKAVKALRDETGGDLRNLVAAIDAAIEREPSTGDRLDLDAIRGRQKRALVSVSQERPNEYDPDHCNRAAYLLTVADVPALLAKVERQRALIDNARTAYADLVCREAERSGHGRDGHLDVDDLRPLFDALCPKWGESS